MTPSQRPPSEPAAYRAARRALARQLHPDRGGDPEAFIAALALYDRHRTSAPVAVIQRTAAIRWQTLRRALRRRRYIDL